MSGCIKLRLRLRLKLYQLEIAFDKGDYQTPTCVACGVKMVQRQGKGGSFWGCRHYPKCKVTMARAAQVLDERRI
ncbi:topoisomerase DNA-binding C4 zinc finger domain-containing protein [Paraburkholderia terrae]|uniref:topoisomerase DNA-binding C4 zinc finger domain-containing protein n=1 Tax=Paraburkholderia terrae TaxID=311230 RepID=UPI002545EF2D|nr:topoisomerase DNA-binding C4 zinc finger domain-containing protein [Paraburkholderia terrae]